MFKCLSYYDDVIKYYQTRILPHTKNYLLVVTHYIFIDLIKKTFKSELGDSSYLTLESTKEKLDRIDLNAIKIWIIDLSNFLSLNMLDEIDEYFQLLSEYFSILKKLIILKAEPKYYKDQEHEELIFKTSHYMINRKIRLETHSGALAIAGGFTIRAFGILVAGMEIFTVAGNWGVLVARLGLSAVLSTSAITVGLATVPIVAGTLLYKWGKKKHKINKGVLGHFKDKFTVGKEIQEGYKICSISIDDHLLNCSKDESEKFTHSMKKASRKIILKNENENSLSATMLTFYTIKILRPSNLAPVDKASTRLLIHNLVK